MKILFLSNFYPPYELGGYEQWCAEVAIGLSVRGHTVKVLTSKYGVPPDHQEDVSSVIRGLYLQSDVSYYRPLDFFLKRSSQEKSNFQLLRREIDGFHPDLIMVWGMWNLSLYLPYWAEKWLPNRVAYYISNYWPMDIDAHTSYWSMPANHSYMEIFKRPLRSFVLDRLHRENYPPPLEFKSAVCCSQYVRDTLIRNGKLPVEAGVLFGGTDPEPFLKSSKLNHQYDQHQELKLLYFGRLIHDKGVHTAIEALGFLKEKDALNNISLTILGSGHPSYEDDLRRLVKKLGVEEHVSFIKQVHRNDIPSWLSNFDVFLFTSIWPEPMARSVMEAMAARLLVIGTEVGGQAEMLANGKNSLTFKPEDAENLSRHIITARDNRSLRIDLAQEGQKLVLEKFSLARMTDEIEHYLINTIQKA